MLQKLYQLILQIWDVFFIYKIHLFPFSLSQKKLYSCCRNFINLFCKSETYFLYIKYIFSLSVCLRRSFTLVAETLSTYFANLRHIFYMSYTSFPFQFVSYVNFILYRNFVCYNEFYFIVRGCSFEKNYLVKARKCFYQDLAMLQI